MEQAPTPFPINNEDYFKNIPDELINKFNLNFINNKKIEFSFIIKTGLYKNNIFIIAKNNKEFSLNEYKNFLSFDNLILKNKQFKSYDSIDEAFNQIIKLFQKEKIIIKNYTEKEIILEIKLSNLAGDEETFEIILEEKKINKDIIIKELIEKVIFLENEIKYLKENKNINIEKEILELKKEKEKQDKEIENLKEMILLLKNNRNKKDNINKNNLNYQKIKINYKIYSKIITDNSLDFVINKIKNIYDIKNKSFELKLLYRGSENNFETDSFHLKCDKIKGTLTLVKTKKNIIFGGFTSESWEGNNILKKDEKAFCFSVNLKKIYNIIKEKEAIKCNKNYGPVFLNDIFGFRKYNLSNGECYGIKACYFSGCENDYEINALEKEFNVEEIEIFQIIKE